MCSSQSIVATHIHTATGVTSGCCPVGALKEIIDRSLRTMAYLIMQNWFILLLELKHIIHIRILTSAAGKAIYKSLGNFKWQGKHLITLNWNIKSYCLGYSENLFVPQKYITGFH